MTESVRSTWGSPGCTQAQLAAALECTKQDVEEMVSCMAPSGHVSGTHKVALAIASALNRQAGIELPVAVAIVRSCRKLCEAVLSTLDFFPPARADEKKIEQDPFLFYGAHAVGAEAVPAIDHYIDVLDGRRINWRRPRHDPYRLACELHRLSSAVKSDDTPALQEQYLELLAGLWGRVAQDTGWIGTVRDGAFMPAPDRFLEPSPAMRQGPGIEADPCAANVYSTCVSVNVSLAARCFKRRMMGLKVADPFDPGSPSISNANQSQVPG